NLSKGSRLNVAVHTTSRCAELSVVKHVIAFQAELHITVFVVADSRVLEDREVRVVETRSVERVAANIAEGAGSRGRKVRRVKEHMVYASDARVARIQGGNRRNLVRSIGTSVERVRVTG